MNKEKENDSNSTIYIYPLKSVGDKKRNIDRLKGIGGVKIEFKRKCRGKIGFKRKMSGMS